MAKTPTFKELFYTADPDARARDEVVLSRNSALEDLVSGQDQLPADAAPASPWKPASGGGVTRDVPQRGVVETVRNVGGNVISEITPYTPPPIDPKKSFASILIADIPNRIEMINRKLLAGDIADAQREREQVEAFINENRADLHGFTRYTGTDQLTALASKRALDLVSSSWLTPEQQALFDPKNNPRSAASDAMKRGFNPAAARFLEAARFGSGPEAEFGAAVLREGGHADVTPGGKSAAAAKPATSAGGANDWANYVDGAWNKVKSALPGSVLGTAAMSPDAIVGALRSGFDSGDQAANFSLVKLALDAANASPADDLGKANTFKSAMKGYSEAMDAWGSNGDPERAARGARVLSSLVEAMPKEAGSAGRQNLAATMQTVSQRIDRASELGATISDEGAARFARVAYHNSFRPEIPLTGADAAASSALLRANVLSKNINVPAPTATKDGEQSLTSGYQVLADLLGNELTVASAMAVDRGTNFDDELKGRETSFAKRLMALGAPNEKSAMAASSMILGLLSSGQPVNIDRLADQLGQAPTTRALIGTGAAKTETALATPETETPFYRAVMGVNPKAVDILPGPGDKAALQKAVSESLKDVTGKVLFEGSSVVNYLTSEVPLSKLGSPEVKGAAVDKLLEAYKKEAGLAYRASDQAALEDFAKRYVDTVVGNIKQYTASSGGLAGDTPFAMAFNTADPGVRVLQEVSRSAKPSVPSGGNFEDLPWMDFDFASETGAAAALTSIFVKGIPTNRPAGESGIALDAKSYLRKLALLPDKQAGAPDVPVNVLSVPPEDAAEGYAAIKAITAKLGKPLTDALTDRLVNKSIPETLRSSKVLTTDQKFILEQAYQAKAREGASFDELSTQFGADLAKHTRDREKELAKAELDELRSRKEINSSE